MSTLVLVIAGDQLAKDIVTAGNPAGALSSATGRSVKVVDVTDPETIKRHDYYGETKDAQSFVRNLEKYMTRVSNALSALSEWEAAGVWWSLGISDVSQAVNADTDEQRQNKLSSLAENVKTLLAWNPFGEKPFKSYISLLPDWGNNSERLSGAIIVDANARIRAAVVANAEKAVLITEPETFTEAHTRKFMHNKTEGLSDAGAIALAQAFATANAANIEGAAQTGENVHVVPITRTVTTYTTFTQTVTRNRLAGLEGKMVSVLADGVAYEFVPVEADGTLTLPMVDGKQVMARKITVGLPYTSALAPMPADTDNNDGSTLGKRRGYGRCVVRVHRSMGGKYGASRSGDLYNEQAWKILDLYDIPFASQMYRETEGVFSGDVEFVLPSGQDEDTTIWLVHDKPYPFRLVSIMAEVDFGEQ